MRAYYKKGRGGKSTPAWTRKEGQKANLVASMPKALLATGKLIPEVS